MIKFVILAVIVLLLIIWGISTQRKLVSAEEMCQNAMSQIGVQQSSRWDALTALSDLVKRYDTHEYQTIMDALQKRQPLSASSTAAQANAQEGLLTQTMGRISAVAEAYPELKADGLYKDTMSSVRQYEDNVRKSRMVFNDTVTKLNRQVRSFPTNLIAGTMGFSAVEYLADEPAKASMPSMAK